MLNWMFVSCGIQCHVAVRYTGTLQDGTIFEKFGHNGEEPLRFVVDEGEFSSCFFLVLLL